MDKKRDFDIEIIEGQLTMTPYHGSLGLDTDGKGILLQTTVRTLNNDTLFKEYVNAVDNGNLPRLYFKNHDGLFGWLPIFAMSKFGTDQPGLNLVLSMQVSGVE